MQCSQLTLLQNHKRVITILLLIDCHHRIHAHQNVIETDDVPCVDAFCTFIHALMEFFSTHFVENFFSPYHNFIIQQEHISLNRVPTQWIVGDSDT